MATKTIGGTLYGAKRIRLRPDAERLRRALLGIGCTPIVEADFSELHGTVREYWSTPSGHPILFTVFPDGRATI